MMSAMSDPFSCPSIKLLRQKRGLLFMFFCFFWCIKNRTNRLSPTIIREILLWGIMITAFI